MGACSSSVKESKIVAVHHRSVALKHEFNSLYQKRQQYSRSKVHCETVTSNTCSDVGSVDNNPPQSYRQPSAVFT